MGGGGVTKIMNFYRARTKIIIVISLYAVDIILL